MIVTTGTAEKNGKANETRYWALAVDETSGHHTYAFGVEVVIGRHDVQVFLRDRYEAGVTPREAAYTDTTPEAVVDQVDLAHFIFPYNGKLITAHVTSTYHLHGRADHARILDPDDFNPIVEKFKAELDQYWPDFLEKIAEPLAAGTQRAISRHVDLASQELEDPERLHMLTNTKEPSLVEAIGDRLGINIPGLREKVMGRYVKMLHGDVPETPLHHLG